ncbi:MAG: VWA domain-containing protein [Clostridia bacterium]|nr:VWA domain-containing protein [Clostridia bacterium]
MAFKGTAGGQGLDYHVDLIMCIDGTRSMYKIINDVKAKALSFHPMFVEEMEAAGKSVQQLRVKLIVFRDYGCDSEPMLESPFFTLGGDIDESAEFHEFASSVEAIGGGDIPENGLEAIALAMKSDWSNRGAVRRHVIMVHTDAPALDLGVRAGAPGYPDDIPTSLPELRELWESQELEDRAKRLILFTPDTEPWTNLINWSQTFHQASANAGVDTTNDELKECIHFLVKSI